MIYIRSTKYFLPFDSEIPLLGIHSGEINTFAKIYICIGCIYICKVVHISILSNSNQPTNPKERQPKFPTVGD